MRRFFSRVGEERVLAIRGHAGCFGVEKWMWTGGPSARNIVVAGGQTAGMADEELTVARGVSDWTGEPVPPPRWSRGRGPLDRLRATLLGEPATVFTVGGDKGLTEAVAKRVVRSFGRSDPATLLRHLGRPVPAGTGGRYRTRVWSRDPGMRRWMVDVCYVPPETGCDSKAADGAVPATTP